MDRSWSRCSRLRLRRSGAQSSRGHSRPQNLRTHGGDDLVSVSVPLRKPGARGSGSQSASSCAGVRSGTLHGIPRQLRLNSEMITLSDALKWMRALPRAASALVGFGLGGCASSIDSSKEPLPVSVSAANYSKNSGEELYARVNGEANIHPEPQAPTQPTKPIFYAFVPADYSADVSMDTVFRELAIPLADNGYFNVVYQVQAWGSCPIGSTTFCASTPGSVRGGFLRCGRTR